MSFDGADLAEVAEILDVSSAEVVGLLTGSELTVAFLGFAPGFAYLVGLPDRLAALPRRSTPRPHVPAGSVAVAGGCAAIYPGESPGGWFLLGRTELEMFDSERPPYARLHPGDRVRFTSLRTSERPAETVATTPGGGRPLLGASGPRRLEVLDPGLLTSVQDQGRTGLAHLGVPRAGPADPEAMTLANWLVGNPDGAAALEMTARGPSLRVTGHLYAAVVAGQHGAVVCDIDGRSVGCGAVWPLEPGQVVTVGRISGGLRAYLAVGGGFESPMVMGSRSSDLLTHLGPGPLVGGDRLAVGPTTRPRGVLLPAGLPTPSVVVESIRLIRGPHPCGTEEWEQLCSERWTVEDRSNRIGVRLVGRNGPLPPLKPIRSTPMVCGAVQVPPDGNPIALLPDHATTGGYPVIGCVIRSDLSRLGQLAPGDEVTFAGVGLAEADARWRQHRRTVEARVTGWFPTEAAT